MSVNWLWKDKLGEIIYKNKENQKWKLEMFGGNMMCCFIYRYIKCDEETNNKPEKYYTFFTWFNDMQHAKRCLKDTRLEDLALGKPKVIKVKINVDSGNKYSDKEMLQFAKLLVDNSYKVELYSHKNRKD